MNFKKINSILNEHAKWLNLAAIAEEHCKQLLQKEFNDSHSEWHTLKLNSLDFRLIEQVFVFNHILRPTPHIRTKIGIYIKDSEKIYFMDFEQVGYYQLDITDNGEVMDDWLVYEK